jgi:hypothetical protein
MRYAAIVALPFAALAHAQPPSPEPTSPPNTAPPVAEALDARASLYQIQVQPRLWYVSVAGDLRLPGTPAVTPSVTLDALNLDSPRTSPYGDATIRFGRWSVNLSAAGSSGDRSTVAQDAGQIGSFAYNAGDPIRSSFDFFTAEASVGYSLGTWGVTPKPDRSFGFVADIALVGGTRLYDISAGVGALSPTTSKADEFFIEPILGARLEMNLAEDFSIDIQSTFGAFPGDRSSFSWDIEVAFAWRPVPNLGFQVGYRNMYLNLETGEGVNTFEWEGGAAGVFAGLQLRF